MAGGGLTPRTPSSIIVLLGERWRKVERVVDQVEVRDVVVLFGLLVFV